MIGLLTAIISILLIIVAMYSVLAILSEKRSHCLQSGRQICGSKKEGYYGENRRDLI